MNDKLKILIVDDDEDILENLSDILTDIGHQADTACSGALAIEKLAADSGESEHSTYDLCLLDFKMPGMDGVELVKRIRQQHPDIRAIMITAYAGDDGAKRALAAGTWHVLRKPVDVPTLLGMIKQVVAR
ncbi:MAG: response regulator [Planctomycetota bacterium]